jgi:hypothetical protein
LPARALFLLISVVAFSYTNSFYWNADTVPRFFNFIKRILDVNAVVTYTVLYLLLFRKSIAPRIFYCACAVILIEAGIHLLAGSRGVIMVIVLNLMLATLAVHGKVEFSRKFVAISVVCLPIILASLAATFTVATFLKRNQEGDRRFDVIRIAELIRGMPIKEMATNAVADSLPPIFDRLGYLDYAAEIIAHSERYRKVISIPAYARSLVDNLLTPGFDIFDQPKIANSLRFVYQDAGKPRKSLVAKAYQSDELTVYGELYNLFAYASLPLFLLIAYMLKRIYFGIQNGSPFLFSMKRLVVLMTFLMLLNSYGLDWVLIDISVLIATLPLWIFFFQSVPERDAQDKFGQSKQSVRI